MQFNRLKQLIADLDGHCKLLAGSARDTNNFKLTTLVNDIGFNLASIKN